MRDQDTTREQLVAENEDLRRRIAAMEGVQAQEALRKSHDELEERVRERTADLTRANDELAIFRKFADASSQGFSMADLDGRITYLNPALCRILGEERPEDPLGKHLSIYFSDESNRRGEQEIRPALNQEGYWEGGLLMLSRQGKSISTWHNTFMIRDESGNPLRMAVVITDITEQKKSEEALRQSHDELRAIYDGMVDGLLVTDIETLQFVRANASICRMLGYSDTELRSLSVRELHPAEALPYILERIRSVKESKQTSIGDIPFLRKDGSIFYAEVIGTLLTYHGRPCSMAIFRDITERTQAQEALRQSEERYRTVVEGQTEIICRIKADGTIIFVNDVYCRFFGKSSQELLGSKWQPVALPDDVPMIEEQLRAISPCEPIAVIENRVYFGIGEVRWMQFVNRGFFDQEDRLTEIQCVGWDITERKQAQEALERERQSLWRMLQASDRERQVISYEIHDGLAQYLAAAWMQFQVFDGLRESNPEEARKAYDAATQLLRQSHSEARRLISEVRPPVIDEIGLETAISHLVHEQRQRGGPEIECLSNVQFGRLPPILENALYRIVQEALANACKHSRSKKVTVTMTQEGQDVRLEVWDRGIGFDPESVEKGRFGLEGIRQRVRLLGGRLTIESTPGSGTLVRVVVPILEKHNDG